MRGRQCARHAEEPAGERGAGRAQRGVHRRPCGTRSRRRHPAVQFGRGSRCPASPDRCPQKYPDDVLEVQGAVVQAVEEAWCLRTDVGVGPAQDRDDIVTVETVEAADIADEGQAARVVPTLSGRRKIARPCPQKGHRIRAQSLGEDHRVEPLRLLMASAVRAAGPKINYVDVVLRGVRLRHVQGSQQRGPAATQGATARCERDSAGDPRRRTCSLRRGRIRGRDHPQDRSGCRRRRSPLDQVLRLEGRALRGGRVHPVVALGERVTPSLPEPVGGRPRPLRTAPGHVPLRGHQRAGVNTGP